VYHEIGGREERHGCFVFFLLLTSSVFGRGGKVNERRWRCPLVQLGADAAGCSHCRFCGTEIRPAAKESRFVFMRLVWRSRKGGVADVGLLEASPPLIESCPDRKKELYSVTNEICDTALLPVGLIEGYLLLTGRFLLSLHLH
jgi:hypothetical protein